MGTSKINDTTIIIQGQTKEGRKFRPSDWAERMSGVLSTFGTDHRIHYSSMLQPLSINGVKCVALDESMKSEHPELFSQVMEFAERNSLNIIDNAASSSAA